MLSLDWVEIPEATCIVGLSNTDRATIRVRLRADAGLDQLEPNDRRLFDSLVEKYRRTVWEADYFASKHLTRAEQRLEAALTPLQDMYLAIEAEIERIPPERVCQVPTFYIARFPITHAQADQFFASEHARWRKLSRFRIGHPHDLPEMPEQIYWPLADAMAHWCGGRLPTVVEWEKAARGSDGRWYPWGNTWDATKGNFGPDYRPAYSRQHALGRTVVDAYPTGSSPYGLLDMLGNLSEWTMTRYHGGAKSTRETPFVKGVAAKVLGQPEWFWSILARQSPGTRYSGFRPVLSRWQRQIWLGGEVPDIEEDQ